MSLTNECIELKKKVLIVFGTRPEAIKIAPIVKALEEASDKFELVTCATAQHRHMLDQVLSIFDIRPDIDLDLMEADQSLPSLTSKAIVALAEVMNSVKPDVTLVQGDTTTAMIAGLASFYEKIPVGHVEAGLRTSDMYDPFPEEINRHLLSSLATYHFAPTQKAANSLMAEGYSKEHIFMTGNTVIDALLTIASREIKPKINVSLTGKKFILVTAHRRENFGTQIRNISTALKEIVDRNPEIEVVYPVHLNPNIQIPVHQILSDVKRVHLIPPLDYEDFVCFMKDSYMILTDSGGIQEEAPSLGKPVLVMRETTERPEAIEAGVARLVGTDPKSIVYHVEKLLSDESEYQKMAQAANPYGDGTSARQIVDILIKNLL